MRDFNNYLEDALDLDHLTEAVYERINDEWDTEDLATIFVDDYSHEIADAMGAHILERIDLDEIADEYFDMHSAAIKDNIMDILNRKIFGLPF